MGFGLKDKHKSACIDSKLISLSFVFINIK